VPAGCVLEDARGVLPESAVFTHREGVGTGSYATFSNLFRYELLHARGGWWVDLDVVCVNAHWPDAEVVLAHQDVNLINCAVLKFPAGHPSLVEARIRSAAGRDSASFTALGPKLTTELVAEGFTPASAVLPASSFYPLHYSQFWNVLDPRRTAAVDAVCAGAYGVHLWNEMFRRFGLEKTVLPPAGSWLRLVYDRLIDVRQVPREYRLKKDCRADKLDLELIPRGNGSQVT
jgi:hypothetical protein